MAIIVDRIRKSKSRPRERASARFLPCRSLFSAGVVHRRPARWVEVYIESWSQDLFDIGDPWEPYHPREPFDCETA